MKTLRSAVACWRGRRQDAVGCFTHSSEQGGSCIRQVDPLYYSKQAGAKTLGTNQTTGWSATPPRTKSLENTANVDGRTGNVASKTAGGVMKAPAASIPDRMWDNHHDDGTLRTLFTCRKTKFCPAVVSDGKLVHNYAEVMGAGSGAASSVLQITL